MEAQERKIASRICKGRVFTRTSYCLSWNQQTATELNELKETYKYWRLKIFSKMKFLLPLLCMLLHTVLAQNVCPDQHVCDADNTCCQMSTGTYGCCPLPDAVCCSDTDSCCPTGYTCSEGLCFRQSPLHRNLTGDIICPGGKYSCPDGDTCCPVDSAYSCCPLPSASCCSDGEHCCPEGTSCDVAHGRCTIPTSAEAHTTVPSTSVDNVICPESVFQCPDGNTCCLMESGEYGCCPLPSAVCCDDRIHCCPKGFKCSTSGCTLSSSEITKTVLVKSTPSSSVGNVICPGDEFQCPDGNTCCLMESGEYGCCPLPSAVCCDDRIHCCPTGSKCSDGGCSPDVPTSTPETVLVQAVRIQEETLNSSIVCPDGHSQCPNGNTCCMLTSGVYGCCPLALATCCLDHIHCCPHGTQCAPYGRCVASTSEIGDASGSVPWVRKVPALRKEIRSTEYDNTA